jgi:hypothetical protein
MPPDAAEAALVITATPVANRPKASRNSSGSGSTVTPLVIARGHRRAARSV